jgi:ankyrin repeat protein
MTLAKASPLVQSLTSAIHSGDVQRLQELLRENAGLATAMIQNEKGVTYSTLHVAVDWPGHYPRVGQSIATLIAAGAEPNSAAQNAGYHAETPLHGAASSDDVEALDALLDGGADIEHSGAVFTNGPAMSDAVIFAQWNAARRLLERGAKTTLTESAALGLMDRVTAYFADGAGPEPRQITAALWHGCRGGQLRPVEFLVQRGAEINWIGWDHLTPFDAATKSGNQELLGWLRQRGAKSAKEL